MTTTDSRQAPANRGPKATGKPSLCVINYNGEEFLSKVLASVLEGEDRDAYGEVVLVDNASDDGSVALVESRFPAVRIVRLAENNGPAAARNAALRSAQSGRIAMIDNDVIPAAGCFRLLGEALDANPRAALAMPRVVYAQSPGTTQYDGAHCHFLGLMTLDNAGAPADSTPDETRNVGAVVTACYLVDRNRWRRNDPFDESYFIYLEDLEFGIRAREDGHEVLSVPAARALHYEGTKGLSLRRTGFHTKRRIFCTIRNRWQLVSVHYQPVTLVLLAPALLAFELFQFAGAVAKGWLGEWWRAARWMAANAGRVRAKRAEVQRTRVRPDSAYLEGGRTPFTAELAANPLVRIAIALFDGFTNLWWNLVRGLLPKGAK